MIDVTAKHPALQYTKEEVVEILSEFNRNLNNIQEDIDIIENWVETQPHLKGAPILQKSILILLILNKFSIENVKRKLDFLFSVKGRIPNMFFELDVKSPEILKLRKIMPCCVLPKLIDLNRVVIYVMNDVDEKFDGYRSLDKFGMDIFSIVRNDMFRSFIVVLDFTTANLSFWTNYNPVMLKMCVQIAEKLLSFRLAGVRIIGLPTFANTLVNFTISLCPQKIQSRISFHKDRTDLTKFFPKELLPCEFGGNGKSYREMSQDFNDLVDTNQDFFEDFMNFTVNESLRPKPLDNDEFLGFHGNFRKLEVD